MCIKEELNEMRYERVQNYYAMTTIDGRGRPFTKNDDGLLITDLPDDYLQKALEWVEDNVLPSEKLFNYSSYWLKQKLEKAIGFYVSNNQLKDLMLIEGYFPVNPSELNWCFRMEFKDCNEYKIKEIRRSNPFVAWLFGKYGARYGHQRSLEDPAMSYEDNPIGCFAYDVLRDYGFPMEADYCKIRSYLGRGCEEATEAFDRLWMEFLSENQDFHSKFIEDAKKVVENYLEIIRDLDRSEDLTVEELKEQYKHIINAALLLERVLDVDLSKCLDNAVLWKVNLESESPKKTDSQREGVSL